MSRLWNSFKIAFAMYSKIPMPRAEWKEENMRYAMCFFPLIGIVIGAFVILWGHAAAWLKAGSLLRGAGYVLIPVLVTGGIHLDGLLDTADALSSYQTRERKLEILKDSSAGAFAVIWCCVWFLVYFALLTELGSAPTLAAGFVLSRSLSALAVERLPSARAGMGASLKAGSRFPWWVLAGYLALYGGAAWLWGEPLAALAALAVSAVFYFVYRSIALGQFGGFTGDLAGWFLQVCELLILMAVVLTERVCALWS